MKKLSLAVIATLMTVSVTVPAMAAEDWEKAYSDIIYQRSLEDNFKRQQGSIFAYKYAVYDIDGNGTPELFCGERDNLSIYTMKNGEANKIGSVGSLFMYIKADENAIIDAPFRFGIGEDWTDTKYVMSNGKIKENPETIGVKYKPGASGATSDEELKKYSTYYINGKVVSESTYSAKAKTFYGKREQLDYYEMTKSGFRVSDLKSKVTKRIVSKQAVASNQKITVNGKNVTVESYLIDDNNYCKLRDIAYILKDTDSCFNVSWSDREKTIAITTGQRYTGTGGQVAGGKKQATSVSANVYVNGSYEQLEGYNIGGSNYFKLRDIADFVAAEVAWNNAAKAVNVVTPNAPKYNSREEMMKAYNNFLKDSSVKRTVAATTSYQGVNEKAYYKQMSNPPQKVSIDIEKIDMEPQVFALEDITGDGMPELFVGKKYDQFIEYSGDCSGYLVYAWENGKMMPLFGQSYLDNVNPTLYTADGKYIVKWSHGTSGYENWEYVSFENGEVKVKNYDKTEKLGTLDGQYEYFSDGLKISKNEFDMHDAQESKKFSFKKINFVDNTSFNRERYLK